MTRVAEIRELADDQLIERPELHKEELFNLRFQLATGQLDNPMRIKAVRHDVARILTVLRERHLEAEVEEDVARADAEALARSRDAQATGKKKGRTLEDVLETAAEDAGEADEAETAEPVPEERVEKPKRRRLRKPKEGA